MCLITFMNKLTIYLYVKSAWYHKKSSTKKPATYTFWILKVITAIDVVLWKKTYSCSRRLKGQAFCRYISFTMKLSKLLTVSMIKKKNGS